MKESLLPHLVCPGCRAELTLKSASSERGEILEGALRCSRCGMSYPIRRGVPRFVPADGYAKNFSFQWQVHRTDLVDSLAGHQESRTAFRTKTRFTESELQGRLVLDVGCGAGRYMEAAADLGAEVIGVDLSFAVNAAFDNVGKRPRQHVVQADLFRLPFRAETFHAIYSIGVLHHTPSTPEAFRAALPYLRPGGLIAIWVYEDAGLYSSRLDRIRAVTVRIPDRLLYALCWIWVPALDRLSRLPLVGAYVNMIPRSMQGRGLLWDIRDTFDLYAPRYRWKHHEPEVLGWFKEAGLQEIEALTFPVSVRGRKAARPVAP